MAMITIMVSINMAIMMLALFMYYIGRSGQERDYRDHVVYKHRDEYVPIGKGVNAE
ncbi:MAG TPA: hypothetical protein PLO50_00350 [Nitrospira sp.]|nr:hypothetical protein [Nitrospira sp.]